MTHPGAERLFVLDEALQAEGGAGAAMTGLVGRAGEAA
jgi:hypothetical protein